MRYKLNEILVCDFRFFFSFRFFLIGVCYYRSVSLGRNLVKEGFVL